MLIKDAPEIYRAEIYRYRFIDNGKFPYLTKQKQNINKSRVYCHIKKQKEVDCVTETIMREDKENTYKKMITAVQRYPETKRLIDDREYRTRILAVLGLAANVIFAVFNGIIGIMSSSAWYGTLAFYYILLSVMRFWVIQYGSSVDGRKKTVKMRRREIRIYRNSSVLFTIMSAGLAGAVILLVNSEGGKHYPGVTIYVAALYAFTKITLAIKDRIQASLKHSPILIAGRTISYIDAWVAILTLQTAMLNSFGSGDVGYARMMNGITGAGVCLITLSTGIFGIISAGKMSMEMKKKYGRPEELHGQKNKNER